MLSISSHKRAVIIGAMLLGLEDFQTFILSDGEQQQQLKQREDGRVAHLAQISLRDSPFISLAIKLDRTGAHDASAVGAPPTPSVATNDVVVVSLKHDGDSGAGARKAQQQDDGVADDVLYQRLLDAFRSALQVAFPAVRCEKKLPELFSSSSASPFEHDDAAASAPRRREREDNHSGFGDVKSSFVAAPEHTTSSGSCEPPVPAMTMTIDRTRLSAISSIVLDALMPPAETASARSKCLRKRLDVLTAQLTPKERRQLASLLIHPQQQTST